MEFDLREGMKYTATKTVTADDTASKYGSGLVEVFATPAMIALMENAAMNVALDGLPEGYNTVGTSVNIKHVKATPVGQVVKSTAKLIKIDGNKLEFEVEAYDEIGKIGFGTHGRYIIETAKFM
jgi:predicted thioesterase